MIRAMFGPPEVEPPPVSTPPCGVGGLVVAVAAAEVVVASGAVVVVSEAAVVVVAAAVVVVVSGAAAVQTDRVMVFESKVTSPFCASIRRDCPGLHGDRRQRHDGPQKGGGRS